MNVIEKASKVLARPVCDHCLGRQFAQLSSGYDNIQRGRMLRSTVAMDIDKEKYTPLVDMSNFHDHTFHNLGAATQKAKKCETCNDIFPKLNKLADKVAKKVRKLQFATFLVGTRLSFDLIEKEEELWERVGIDHCEPLKAEINREMGKILEKKLKKRFNKRPDVNIILNIQSNSADIEINPVFIYGEYQKLVRGIPQTKWPSRKYKTSVEQLIAKPFMKAMNGKAHKLHGMGREDIDARCLAWRPFVLEIIEPAKRNIKFQALARKIDKRVKTRGMRKSNIAEVRRIKETRADKSYRALVVCDRKISKKDLLTLKRLKEINQKTPQRVLHRRGDLLRKRRIRKIKAKYLSPRKFLLEIRAEAGLYVKELISGDEGRTLPNVSLFLGSQCKCKELDVIGIHKK